MWIEWFNMHSPFSTVRAIYAVWKTFQRRFWAIIFRFGLSVLAVCICGVTMLFRQNANLLAVCTNDHSDRMWSGAVAVKWNSRKYRNETKAVTMLFVRRVAFFLLLLSFFHCCFYSHGLFSLSSTLLSIANEKKKIHRFSFQHVRHMIRIILRDVCHDYKHLLHITEPDVLHFVFTHNHIQYVLFSFYNLFAVVGFYSSVFFFFFFSIRRCCFCQKF